MYQTGQLGQVGMRELKVEFVQHMNYDGIGGMCHIVAGTMNYKEVSIGAGVIDSTMICL